jgi:hypothetical protein
LFKTAARVVSCGGTLPRVLKMKNNSLSTSGTRRAINMNINNRYVNAVIHEDYARLRTEEVSQRRFGNISIALKLRENPYLLLSSSSL